MAQKRKSLDEGALEFFKSQAPWKNEEPTSATQAVALNSICFSSTQPRRFFDPQKLEQLVHSVKEHGILEPLLVRPQPSGNFELVAGERRYRAAKEAGLSEVPVIVRELSDDEALQLALIENLQREDLNPVEETEGILQLLALRLNITSTEVTSLLYRMYNETKGNVNSPNPNVRVNDNTQVIITVFNSLGLMTWESFVKNRLPLTKLPDEVLAALRQGKIAYTKAQAIARIKDESERKILLEEATSKDLSLSKIKEKIRAMQTEADDSPSLKSRMQLTIRRFNKEKIWENSKKRKKLESLLAQMEALLEEI